MSVTADRSVICTCCGIRWSTHPDFLNHLTVRERIAADIEEGGDRVGCDCCDRAVRIARGLA